MAATIIPEIGFIIQGASREECIALADDFGNHIMAHLGGEPWIMVDDDWKRMHPDERLTLTDDQGFMYHGVRKYIFKGPMVGKQETSLHDGYTVQKQVRDAGDM